MQDTYNVSTEGKNSSISSTDSGIAIETMDINCEELGNKQTDGQKKSPTLSIRSTVISINSIESSVLDSDSDEENVDGLIVRKLGETTPQNPDPGLLKSAATPGVILSQIVENGLPSGGIISQNANQRAQIGSVVVDRSNEVTFGDKNYFQGPVTIKQFVVDSSLTIKNGKDGNDNPGYDLESDGVNANNPSKKYSSNNDATIKTDKFVYKNITVKKKTLFTGLLVAIIAILVFIIGIIVWTTQSQSPGEPTEGILIKVSRPEWVASPPKQKLDQLFPPVSRVIIAHTATESCDTLGKCVFHVRFIQNFHMESRGWDDIAYNFLVGGDGRVYEGRGWDNQGAHTKGYNKDSICIAFIGEFSETLPKNMSINAANLLIDEGIRLNKVKKDYKLYGARQLNGLESPGQKFYELIKTWPHWTDKVEVIN